MEHAFERWARPTERDLERYVQLMQRAFGSPPDQAARWLGRVGSQHARVVLADGEVAAALAFYDMGYFFGGRSVPCWGVAAVAVAAEHRRRGLASAMMRRVLQEGAERGVALSGLFAANHALYRNVGYGAASSRFMASIAPDRIGVTEREGTVRPIGEDEGDLRQALYRRWAASRHGFLDRDAGLWRRATHDRDDRPHHCYLATDPEGQPQGYVTFHHAGGLGVSQVLEVVDLVACTPWAYRRLLSLLADHASMVGELRFPTAPSDPLLAHLPAPRVNMRLIECSYLRLLDLEAAMELRGWPAAVRGRVELQLDDPVIPTNSGVWTLEVSDGEARIVRGGAGSIRLGARGLASVYSGFRSPMEAKAAGLLDGPDRALAVMGTLFASPQPWMPEMY
jgi:predicted acetyltransferase